MAVYCRNCWKAEHRRYYTEGRKRPLTPKGFRRCTKCRGVKPWDARHFYNNGKTGFTWVCRACHSGKRVTISTPADLLGRHRCVDCRRYLPISAFPQATKWATRCRPHSATFEKAERLRFKLMAIAAYGGHCSRCGETEPIFLGFDHINNDGAEHRRRDRFAIQLTRWMYRHGYPPGFALLCHNCHLAKTRAAIRIHKGVGGTAKQRIRVLAKMGAWCRCCDTRETDFLTIEHLDGDSHIYRKKGILSGASLYCAILREDPAIPRLSILCMNCNFAAFRYGACPHSRHQITESALDKCPTRTSVATANL